MVSIWPILCAVLGPFGLLNCDDPSIIELTASSFDKFITDNEFVMVKFYTPWCQHCKNFRSEYSKLSSTLQTVSSKIKLAKVNVDEHKQLGNKYGIRSFPTLKYFIKDKQPLDYTGKREADVINSWMTLKMDPIQILDTLDDIEGLVEDTNISVIGFFDDPDSKEVEIFKNAVHEDDSTIQFAMVTSLNLRLEYSAAENKQVMLYKPFDDKETIFQGDFNLENLKNFFTSASKPLLIDFQIETAAQMFQNNAENHLFIFISKTDKFYKNIENDLRTLSKKWRKDFVFVIVNMDVKVNFKLNNLFGVQPEKLPTYRIVKFDEGITKYKPKDHKITIDGISIFIQEFLANTLSPDLLSQELPSDWNANPVKVLVASNFDEVALDVQKDVLVVFYSPRCGHCNNMEKAYNQLGEFYKNSKTVVIAKIDATINELEHTKIRSFPTIKLYSRGDNKVKDYNDDRTVEKFIAFLEETSDINKTVLNDEL